MKESLELLLNAKTQLMLNKFDTLPLHLKEEVILNVMLQESSPFTVSKDFLGLVKDMTLITVKLANRGIIKPSTAKQLAIVTAKSAKKLSSSFSSKKLKEDELLQENILHWIGKLVSKSSGKSYGKGIFKGDFMGDEAAAAIHIAKGNKLKGISDKFMDAGDEMSQLGHELTQKASEFAPLTIVMAVLSAIGSAIYWVFNSIYSMIVQDDNSEINKDEIDQKITTVTNELNKQLDKSDKISTSATTETVVNAVEKNIERIGEVTDKHFSETGYTFYGMMALLIISSTTSIAFIINHIRNKIQLTHQALDGNVDKSFNIQADQKRMKSIIKKESSKIKDPNKLKAINDLVSKM